MDASELKTNGHGYGTFFSGLNSKALFPVTTNAGPDQDPPCDLVCVCVRAHTCESLSCVPLFAATPRTVAHQAPLSMEFLPGKNTGVGCHLPLQEIFPTRLGHLESWTKIFIIDFHLSLSRFDFFDQ